MVLDAGAIMSTTTAYTVAAAVFLIWCYAMHQDTKEAYWQSAAHERRAAGYMTTVCAKQQKKAVGVDGFFSCQERTHR